MKDDAILNTSKFVLNLCIVCIVFGAFLIVPLTVKVVLFCISLVVFVAIELEVIENFADKFFAKQRLKRETVRTNIYAFSGAPIALPVTTKV